MSPAAMSARPGPSWRKAALPLRPVDPVLSITATPSSADPFWLRDSETATSAQAVVVEVGGGREVGSASTPRNTDAAAPSVPFGRPLVCRPGRHSR